MKCAQYYFSRIFSASVYTAQQIEIYMYIIHIIMLPLTLYNNAFTDFRYLIYYVYTI